jgi:hypothetical protein
MTADELVKVKYLRACRFLPGSPDKRFAAHLGAIADLDPSPALTKKQGEYLERCFHRYRRQIQPKIGVDDRILLYGIDDGDGAP